MNYDQSLTIKVHLNELKGFNLFMFRYVTDVEMNWGQKKNSCSKKTYFKGEATHTQWHKQRWDCQGTKRIRR